MKEMIKNAAILFAITLVAGCLLGLVNEVTKDPIAAQQLKAKNEACKNVFQDAERFEVISTSPDLAPEALTGMLSEQGYDVSLDEIAAALDGSGTCLGYVVTVTDHEGYGGDIQFSVGVRNEGIVNGISILKISETAGLGMRAEMDLKPQFENKPVTTFTYTKTGAASDSEIDAISGATITTNAVVNGVNAALTVYENALAGQGGASNE